MGRNDSAEIPLLCDAIDPFASRPRALGKTQGLDNRHDNESASDTGEGDWIPKVFRREVGYEQRHSLPACWQQVRLLSHHVSQCKGLFAAMTQHIYRQRYLVVSTLQPEHTYSAIAVANLLAIW